jgi:hypothetical protein
MFETEPGKRCSTCGIWRPLTQYYTAKGTRDGLRGDCKPCFRERAAKRYQENPGPARERAREWARNNPERVKARMEKDKASGRKAARDRQSYIRRTYGLTEADYDLLVAKQGARCATCGYRPTGKARLHLDHDHDTGAIRGFLCFRCNNGIGDFGDSVGVLLNVIAYLTPTERPPQLDLRLAALKELRLQRELLGQ